MPFAYAECGFRADLRHGEHAAAERLQQALHLRDICAEQLLRIVLPAERIAGERFVLEPAVYARAERVEQRKLRSSTPCPARCGISAPLVIQRRQCRHIRRGQPPRCFAALPCQVRINLLQEIWKNGS